MNRAHRRALARNRQRSITREPLNEVKHSHRLPAQVCALWVPAAQGYIEYFPPTGFRVIELAALAHHYDEAEACSAALAFRDVTGLRVVVRPVYLQQVTDELAAVARLGSP